MDMQLWAYQLQLEEQELEELLEYEKLSEIVSNDLEKSGRE